MLTAVPGASWQVAWAPAQPLAVQPIHNMSNGTETPPQPRVDSRSTTIDALPRSWPRMVGGDPADELAAAQQQGHNLREYGYGAVSWEDLLGRR